jgi:hypothetical protein
MTEVTLTKDELLTVAIVGVQRGVYSKAANASPRYGIKEEDSWQSVVVGTIGEYVLAKHTGTFWSGALGDYQAADVGQWQVRTTPYPHGHLRMHRKDSSESAWVLITGSFFVYTIRGWIWGKDGKKDEYWGDKFNTGRPAFWVPQDVLNPIETLPRHSHSVHNQPGNNKPPKQLVFGESSIDPETGIPF